MTAIGAERSLWIAARSSQLRGLLPFGMSANSGPWGTEDRAPPPCFNSEGHQQSQLAHEYARIEILRRRPRALFQVHTGGRRSLRVNRRPANEPESRGDRTQNWLLAERSG